MVPLIPESRQRLCCVIGLMLCLLAPISAAAIEFPSLSGRVVDAAGVISSETEQVLQARLVQLEKETGAQLVVATVPSLQERSIEEYANLLFRHWQLGQKELNNGVLFVTAPNDRKTRIEVGYGLEGQLTDALSGLIIRDDVLPRFRKGDFTGGVVAGTEAIIAILAGNMEAVRQYQQTEEKDRPIPALMFFLFFLFVWFNTFFSQRKHRRRRSGRAGRMGPLGGGSIGGFGGSFGGGFGGGGGSSGGGGASGGW